VSTLTVNPLSFSSYNQAGVCNARDAYIWVLIYVTNTSKAFPDSKGP